MRLRELLSETRVLRVQQRLGKRHALAIAMDSLARMGLVTDGRAVLTTLLDREALTPTAIGSGFAVPHAFSNHVAEPTLTVIETPRGIDFETPDGLPVRWVFLLLLPPEKQSGYLRLLSRLARILNDPTLPGTLEDCGGDPGRIVETLTAREDRYEARFEAGAEKGVSQGETAADGSRP